jgi:polyphosphate kinase
VVAPLGLHEAILGLIAREAAHARAGQKARIVAQMNALVDVDVIDALYAASQAGVEIRLAVRGICCLRPGIPGLSERIQVRALIDRFLEHERVFRFANGGAEEVYLSSADWMPRNFHRRVEILIPILDPGVRERVNHSLDLLFADNVKSWDLGPDGKYTRVPPGTLSGPAPVGAPPIRVQARLMELARERSRQNDALARTGRFHILAVPQLPPEEMRRGKNGKKKKHLP